MRAEERDPAYLWDMLEAAQTIMGFMKGLALEQFTAEGKEALIVRLPWSANWKSWERPPDASAFRSNRRIQKFHGPVS